MRVSVIQDLREDENGDGEEEEKVFLKPVIEDRNMELARKCSEIISDIHYKEEFKKSKGKCIFVPDTPQLNHVKSLSAFISEVKYKGAAKKDLSNSLYQQMPATIDSVFAKELMQLQSKVLYKQKHDAEKGTSDYAHMKEPPDIKHAMEVNKYQSDVSYKKDVQDTHRYTEVLNRPDIKMATEITKIVSDAEYKKGRGEMNKEPTVLGRLDFEHAKGVSKLLSQLLKRSKACVQSLQMFDDHAQQGGQRREIYYLFDFIYSDSEFSSSAGFMDFFVIYLLLIPFPQHLCIAYFLLHVL
ncbi:nebulette isoform 7-T9 [Ara ararauna]